MSTLLLNTVIIAFKIHTFNLVLISFHFRFELCIFVTRSESVWSVDFKGPLTLTEFHGKILQGKFALIRTANLEVSKLCFHNFLSSSIPFSPNKRKLFFVTMTLKCHIIICTILSVSE